MSLIFYQIVFATNFLEINLAKRKLPSYTQVSVHKISRKRTIPTQLFFLESIYASISYALSYASFYTCCLISEFRPRFSIANRSRS